MDALLFHPKLVHVPMALSMLMPLLSGVVLLAWLRRWLPARAWALVVGMQLLLVVFGALSMESGEDEEHRVEQVVPERHIEAHEEAAKAFMAGSVVTLVLMVVALVMGRTPLGRRLAVTATLATLAVSGLGYRVGQRGGALVYVHGAASAYATPGAAGGGASGEADSDGDHDQDHDGHHDEH